MTDYLAIHKSCLERNFTFAGISTNENTNGSGIQNSYFGRSSVKSANQRNVRRSSLIEIFIWSAYIVGFHTLVI